MKAMKRVELMNEEVYYERCAGIDVHKKFLMVCLRIGRKTEVPIFRKI